MTHTAVSITDTIMDSPTIRVPPNTPTSPSKLIKIAPCILWEHRQPSAEPGGNETDLVRASAKTDHKAPVDGNRGRIYSISELLQLGTKCVENNVMVKVRSEAIEGRSLGRRPCP